MVRTGSMTLETRIPFIAAIELNGDYVQLAVVMTAAGLRVNINTVNVFAMYFSHHFTDIMRQTAVSQMAVLVIPPSFAKMK